MRQLEEAEIVKLQSKCGSAVEHYLNELGKHSKKTEASYLGDFNRFIDLQFNKTINTITTAELDSVDYEMIMEYREDMYKTLANTTINRHINTLKSILKHLKVRNLLNNDMSFLDQIKKLPEKTVEIEYMPLEVVDMYVSEAGREKYHGELKQNMIKFAADTGLRLDEVLKIELKQFTVTGETVMIQGYGKGNKKYVDEISINMYNDLLKTVNMSVTDNPKRRMFYPISTKNAGDMMARIRKNLDFEDRTYSFHSLKKTAVTYTYRMTGCILAAQRKGRHEDLNTTRKYLKGEEFGVTGMYSLRSMGYDQELYKKVSTEDLLNGLEEMNKDFLHLLNIKLNQMKNKK